MQYIIYNIFNFCVGYKFLNYIIHDRKAISLSLHHRNNIDTVRRNVYPDLKVHIFTAYVLQSNKAHSIDYGFVIVYVSLLLRAAHFHQTDFCNKLIYVIMFWQKHTNYCCHILSFIKTSCLSRLLTVLQITCMLSYLLAALTFPLLTHTEQTE